MKILLVVPYQNIEPYILPNLGLGYLASSLRKYGHKVDYLDCLKQGMGLSEWGEFLKTNTYDIIGIQMYSYTEGFVKKMLQIAKSTLGDVITIAGGPHPNAVPQETLEDHIEIDYVIHGEGEISFAKLLSALNCASSVKEELKSIPNLAYRDETSNKIVINKRVFIDDLDSLNWPSWDLMDPRTYPRLSHGLLNRAYPIAPIYSTRGCPYSCTFCSSEVNMGKKIRKRSPSNVVDEVEFLVKEYGVKEVHFEDDNFTFYKDFAKEICQAIIDRSIKVSWACPNGVRLDSLDTELLKIMERSGCYSFAVGIESGSDRILKLMNKGTTNMKMREKIRLVHEVTNIRMTGFIIVGFPGETEDDLKKTESMILDEPLHRMAAGPFIPLPGTRIYEDLMKEGKISKKYSQNNLFAYQENVFTCGTLSKDRIFDFMRKLHLKFYLRFKIIFNVLKEINSFEQIKVATKLLFFWLGLVKIKKD